MTNPATMTPPDIDAILNDLSHQRAKLITRAESLRTAAHHARTGRFPNENRAAVFDAQADEYTPQIAAIADQIKPYNDEFDRRGGWTRAFLVQNTGGHVHASMSCSTCYPTTRYAWLTDYSGKDEDQIVYAAGELACTTCYPSAPTEVLTRVGEIRRPTDLEREQRAAEKATKNAQRAAAAVLDPTTGKTLYKTDRAASNAIAAALGDLHWGTSLNTCLKPWRGAISAVSWTSWCCGRRGDGGRRVIECSGCECIGHDNCHATRGRPWAAWGRSSWWPALGCSLVGVSSSVQVGRDCVAA